MSIPGDGFDNWPHEEIKIKKEFQVGELVEISKNFETKPEFEWLIGKEGIVVQSDDELSLIWVPYTRRHYQIPNKFLMPIYYKSVKFYGRENGQ